ncbi:hypothetical protein BJ741DRAFT_603975 [Chytriomyces cf. hyalinus JEL632]|nr:hypothetical protein BJ741DRAFT_603975 [Chytriomyces cf. hyalinus JEL632]
MSATGPPSSATGAGSARQQLNKEAQRQYRERRMHKTAHLETRVAQLVQTLSQRGCLVEAQRVVASVAVVASTEDQSDSDMESVSYSASGSPGASMAFTGAVSGTVSAPMTAALSVSTAGQSTPADSRRHGNLKDVPVDQEALRYLPPDLRKVYQNRLAQRASRARRQQRIKILEGQVHALTALLQSTTSFPTPAMDHTVTAPLPPSSISPHLPVKPSLSIHGVVPATAIPSVPFIPSMHHSILPYPTQDVAPIYVSAPAQGFFAQPQSDGNGLGIKSPVISPKQDGPRLPSLRSLGLPLMDNKRL